VYFARRCDHDLLKGTKLKLKLNTTPWVVVILLKQQNSEEVHDMCTNITPGLARYMFSSGFLAVSIVPFERQD
jgi:hypothetical protein